jgi:guanine deaminase
MPDSGSASTMMGMQAFRSSILRFDQDGQTIHDGDGLLVVERQADGVSRVVAVGAFSELAGQFAHVPCRQWPGACMAPGFVDMHIHYPQTDVIGSPAEGLLPWLENYTFPHESRFHDPAYARSVADFFLDELLRNGVTTALCFATSHPESVDAIMQAAQLRSMRLLAGKVLQDQHCPDGVRDHTEQSLRDTETLIQRWHGKNRLGYAITPRFVPTCSAAQLQGAGALASKHPDVWVQSHVSENRDEIAWVQALYPKARSYLQVYEDFGLLRKRSVFAHGIYLDNEDRQRLAQSGAAIAVSPTSNLFLGSGFFDHGAAQALGVPHGLASDVGGGTSFSPFHTMRAAYYVGREGQSKVGMSLSPANLWWQHTAGAAKALDLAGVVGNLQVGAEADFVVLDPQRSTPLLARKCAQANSLDEWMFACIVLGDDRLISAVCVDGALTHSKPASE